MTIIFKNRNSGTGAPSSSDFTSDGMIVINSFDGVIYTTKLVNGVRTVVTSTKKFEDDNVVSTASAGKILRLNSNGKLPADITGNAATSTSATTAGTATTALSANTLNGLTTSIADLNSLSLVGGKLSTAVIPGSVDDIVEFATFSAFPATGSKGLMYCDVSTGLLYRWSGSVYSEIASGDTVKMIGTRTGNIALSDLKSDLALNNVNNTADSAKNVASAAKLTTARNIIVGNSTKSFDGSANVSFSFNEIAPTATTGQLMSFNGTTWVAVDIDSITINGGSY